MISLKERDLNSFFEAPFNAYGKDSLYVSPMKSDLERFLSADKNPLFSSNEEFTFFTAMKDGKSVGRITAHVHKKSNERHGYDRSYFGFFDCANDKEVAAALLGAAEDWGRARGHKEIMGNFNLTAMQQAGIQTGGFENQPYTDQIWGASWLPELLEANGYTSSFPMTTFEQDISKVDVKNLVDMNENESLKKQGFVFAPITRSTLGERLEDSRTILNESFIDNPMFVPVTKEEFEFQAKEMKWIMDPRISTVVHCKGEVAGAVIAIPDLNPFVKACGSKLGITTPWHFLKHRMNRKRAVVIFQGVKPAFQGMGLNPMMLMHLLGQMRRAGYEKVGGTWIADENKASLRQAEKGGAKPLHRLHLYSKQLGAA
ncbi:MAG: GNAT family N-acetyltransferase [Pseudomonadota bacterium]